MMLDFDQTYQKKSRRSFGPDLTPLIDTLFLLLVFFLLTSVMTRPSIEIDLPEVEKSFDHVVTDLTLQIRSDGTMLIQDERIPTGGLKAALVKNVDSLARKGLTVEADRRTPFRFIVEVMDTASSLDIELLSFVVIEQ